MKKFRIITILAALTLAFAALALTGCKKGLNLGNLGYSAKVVYDFDGETQTGLGKRTFYYKPLTPIIKPDTDLSADIVISTAGIPRRSTKTATRLKTVRASIFYRTNRGISKPGIRAKRNPYYI